MIKLLIYNFQKNNFMDEEECSALSQESFLPAGLDTHLPYPFLYYSRREVSKAGDNSWIKILPGNFEKSGCLEK